MRRWSGALFAGVLVLTSLAVSHPVAARLPTGPAFARALLAALAPYQGRASLVVSDLRTGFRFAYESDVPFRSASLYKLGVMAEAYRRAASGGISLDRTEVTIAPEDVEAEDGSTPEGTVLTVREAIERMIVVSDNSSARALLRLLDATSVNATMAALGMPDTQIHESSRSTEEGPYNTTTARDMERFFTGLERGAIVNARASAEMLAVLVDQRINDRLPTGLPAGAVIAHKTGNLDGFAHDAGLILTPFGPRVVILLCSEFADYEEVTSLSERVAATAYAMTADLFAAEVAIVGAGPTSPMGPGDAVVTSVKVTNLSTFAWSGAAQLGSHWRSSEGQVLLWDSARVRLPALEPGQAVTVRVADRAPSRPGTWLLTWELVDDTIGWTTDAITESMVVKIETDRD